MRGIVDPNRYSLKPVKIRQRSKTFFGGQTTVLAALSLLEYHPDVGHRSLSGTNEYRVTSRTYLFVRNGQGRFFVCACVRVGVRVCACVENGHTTAVFGRTHVPRNPGVRVCGKVERGLFCLV